MGIEIYDEHSPLLFSEGRSQIDSGRCLTAPTHLIDNGNDAPHAFYELPWRGVVSHRKKWGRNLNYKAPVETPLHGGLFPLKLRTQRSSTRRVASEPVSGLGFRLSFVSND